MRELDKRVKADDPVRGIWKIIDSKDGTIWYDASSLAMGCCLEIGGSIIEDASWIRKENDSGHINLTELEAVLKGVTMAVKNGIQDLTIMTDSMTVFNWIKSIISKDKRVKTQGLSEILVRRRLSMLADIFNECSLNTIVKFTPSEHNKADALTRVPKTWLTTVKEYIPKDEMCFISQI